MEQLKAEMHDLTTAIKRLTELHGEPKRGVPTTLVITVAVAVLIPLSGFTMQISNRVAVLESKSVALESSATDLAALKQQIQDFRLEFDEWRKQQDSKR